MFSDTIGILAILIGVIFVLIALRVKSQFDRLKFYIPVDTINKLPQEIPVIVKGSVTCANPLTSPLLQKPCVYYYYLLQKLEMQPQTNGDTKPIWKTIDEDEQRIPFFVKDQSGQILIKPDKSTIRDVNNSEKILTPGTITNSGLDIHQILAGIMTMPQQSNSSPEEKALETALFTDTEVNIYGILSMEGNEMFFQNTHDYPLIITTKTKEQLIQSEGMPALKFFLFAGVLMLVGLYLMFS